MEMNLRKIGVPLVQTMMSAAGVFLEKTQKDLLERIERTEKAESENNSRITKLEEEVTSLSESKVEHVLDECKKLREENVAI